MQRSLKSNAVKTNVNQQAGWGGSMSRLISGVMAKSRIAYGKVKSVLWMGSMVVIIVGLPILYAINTQYELEFQKLAQDHDMAFGGNPQ